MKYLEFKNNVLQMPLIFSRDIMFNYDNKQAIRNQFNRWCVKGRDFYDMLWYLGKKIKPNYELFNNAIIQTEKKDYSMTEDTIKDFLIERLECIDFGSVKKDVERFLEDKSELQLLNKEIISNGIRSYFK